MYEAEGSLRFLIIGEDIAVRTLYDYQVRFLRIGDTGLERGAERGDDLWVLLSV